MSTALIDRLSIAARAVLEALPVHQDFYGPTANALAMQIELLSDSVEQLLLALWGLDDDNSG